MDRATKLSAGVRAKDQRGPIWMRWTWRWRPRRHGSVYRSDLVAAAELVCAGAMPQRLLLLAGLLACPIRSLAS